MAELNIGNPLKSESRNKVIGYALLYILHMADLYIQSVTIGSENLESFINWWNNQLNNAKKQIDKRKNWDVHFKEGDTYKMSKKQYKLREIEAVIGLKGIDEFFKALVRLYWDECAKSNNLRKTSLTDFVIKFVPIYKKSLIAKKY